jgi:hypothetical protein
MYDTNNLDSTYCCNTPAEQAWTEGFQTATLALFQTLPPTAALYSSTCLVHCLSSNADWYSFTTNGVSLAQAVGNWFFQGDNEQLVSDCTGWNCTLACSGGPWMPTNTPCATTTNVCANDYMTVPAASSSAPVAPSNQQTAAGMAAWNAAQRASRVSAGTEPVQNSDWDATSQVVTPGAVSASEPALTQQQQQQLAQQAQLQAQQAQMAAQQAQLQAQLQAQG